MLSRLIGFLLVSMFTLAPATVSAEGGKLAHVVGFTDYEDGDIGDWLQSKGFKLERDADNRRRIQFDVGDNGLTIVAKRSALGFLPNETVNLPEFSYVEVDWGVNRFPDGVSYEQGVRNEALMLFVFEGDERQPSGSMFIPDSPYFVGLFLCHGDDVLHRPYTGTYFKKSGRYVCVGRPKEGELVTSRFDLLKAYREYFDREGDDDPAISGIGLGVDTKKATGGGRSSAFIREIRFYK